MKVPSSLVIVLFACASSFAGELISKKAVVPPEEDHWKFKLAVPGWLGGVEGTSGINGRNSEVDVGFKDLVNKIDFSFSLRAEASKGRFGIMGEIDYLSLSDSLGVDGALHKVDVRLDEYLADFGLRWRLVEGERGFVDAIVGVRYTNLYQHLHLQSDDAGIGEASAGFVDRVSEVIRDRLNELLSDGDFGNALTGAVETNLSARLDGRLGANPDRSALGIGPLGAGQPLRVALRIEEIVRQEEARLRAEINALQLQGAARAAAVRQRVEAAKGELEKRVADVLEKELNRTLARGDDWWDPYVGVRARYNFTPAVYVIARGDIGGFGVGSDLMWQAECALGLQLTRSIYAELGYRALSFDYEKDGLTYDMITHGAQVTVGLEF